MNKKNKILIIVLATAILLLGGTIAYQAEPSPVEARTTNKSCGFVEMGGNLFAFCDDGTEYRVIDAVTPTPKK